MEETVEHENERKIPLVSDRYKVVFLDSVVVIGLMVLYSLIIGKLDNQIPVWVRVFLYSTLFLYEPLCLALFGKTLGHWSGNLRVVKEKDESKNISFLAAMIRAIMKYLLGIISLFTIAPENKGRAIHDMAAGSIVLFEE